MGAAQQNLGVHEVKMIFGYALTSPDAHRARGVSWHKLCIELGFQPKPLIYWPSLVVNPFFLSMDLIVPYPPHISTSRTDAPRSLVEELLRFS